MSLAEALLYLRKRSERRFGSKVSIAAYDVNSHEARRDRSVRTLLRCSEVRLPIVVIDGKARFFGELPIRKIHQEIDRLLRGHR